ncbi:mas-related G-protein coupled receptor member H-like isoform X2 [Pelodiscus sinensis]|uniref:mas-related G-protein coupled receptor member H-like isoform X2 n=1 Tax=Pelodiscus sinensis TaxID=13735 RepID=UPI003F6C4D88
MMTELRTTSLPLTESSLENGTNFETDSVTTAIISVALVICLLGLVGNGIVLWFLSFRIKRNPFTVYVLNLAAADFGFLFCLAIFLTIYVMRLFHLFYLMKHLNFQLLIMYSTSLYLLAAISAERCVSVLCPIWHRCRHPKHLSAILCTLLWALSCLLNGLGFFVCASMSVRHYITMLIPLSVTSFLIFTPIMVTSSLTLFIKVRCSSQRYHPGKLYMVILLNVLFFLIFAVPLSIVTFLQNFVYHFNLLITTFMLASMNSSINLSFLVGSYRNRQFKRSVKKALHSVFEEEADTKQERVRAT